MLNYCIFYQFYNDYYNNACLVQCTWEARMNAMNFPYTCPSRLFRPWQNDVFTQVVVLTVPPERLLPWFNYMLYMVPLPYGK